MIPNPDLPGTIPSTRNLPLEIAEAEIMVVHLNRQPANPRGMGKGFPQHPALEHPVFFETEVIVMRSSKMLLDDKAGIAHRFIQVPVPKNALKRLPSAPVCQT